MPWRRRYLAPRLAAQALMRLTPEQVSFFKEYGYLIVRQVLDLELCQRARDELWKSMDPNCSIKRDVPSSWVGPVREQDERTEGTAPREDGGWDPHLKGYRWQAHHCGKLDFMIEMLATNAKVWEIAEQLLGSGQVAPVEHIRGIYCTLPKGDAPYNTEFFGQPMPPNTDHGERESCHNDAHGMHIGIVGLIDRVPPGGGSTMMWPLVHRRVFHLMSQQCMNGRVAHDGTHLTGQQSFRDSPPTPCV